MLAMYLGLHQCQWHYLYRLHLRFIISVRFRLFLDQWDLATCKVLEVCGHLLTVQNCCYLVHIVCAWYIPHLRDRPY